MKKKILINSTSGVIQVAVNLVVTFFTIPIYYSQLGNEHYGIYSVVTAISIIGNFINFGFNISVIKYVSEKGSCRDSDRDIVASFSLAGALVSVVILAGLYFRTEIMDSILRIPGRLLTSSTYEFFTYVMVSNIFIFLGEIPGAVLDSLQKIYLTNVLSMINILMNRGGGAVILMLGGDLSGVGLIYLIASFSWFVLLLFFFFRHWRFTTFSGLFAGYCTRAAAHLQYGYKVLLTGISGFFYEPFMKVLISRYIGVAEVGYFDIGFRLKNIVWSVLTKMMYPLTPLIAGYTDAEKIRMLIDRISRMLLMVSIPLIAVVLTTSDRIIQLWMGNEYDQIIFSTRVIIGGYLILISSIPVYQYLLIKNHPDKNFIIQLLNASLSFIFFIVTVPCWGYEAAVYSFVGAVLATNVLSVYYQKKYLNSVIFLPLSMLFRSIFIALVLYGVNLLIKKYLAAPLSTEILMLVTVDCAVLTCFLIAFKLITAGDLRWIFKESKAGAGRGKSK